MARVLIPTWQARHVTQKYPLKRPQILSAKLLHRLTGGSRFDTKICACLCLLSRRSLSLIYVLLNIAILCVELLGL
jgi:hypothetical protein